MHRRKYLTIIGLVMAATLIDYLGAYFLAADYVDVGDSTPYYLVRYRVGFVSLHRFASFFEPARHIDESCFQKRRGAVMDWETR